MDLILNEQRFLTVYRTGLEVECRIDVGAERAGVCDPVREPLANAARADITARLLFLHAALPGQRAFDVDLPQSAMLLRNHRRGRRIRRQPRIEIADHAVETQHRRPRRDALIGRLRHRFGA